ncbi:hypothetical protein VTI74DRAFT_9660 [Chaetomium olivicolor]
MQGPAGREVSVVPMNSGQKRKGNSQNPEMALMEWLLLSADWTWGVRQIQLDGFGFGTVWRELPEKRLGQEWWASSKYAGPAGACSAVGYHSAHVFVCFPRVRSISGHPIQSHHRDCTASPVGCVLILQTINKFDHSCSQVSALTTAQCTGEFFICWYLLR